MIFEKKAHFFKKLNLVILEKKAHFFKKLNLVILEKDVHWVQNDAFNTLRGLEIRLWKNFREKSTFF